MAAQIRSTPISSSGHARVSGNPRHPVLFSALGSAPSPLIAESTSGERTLRNLPMAAAASSFRGRIMELGTRKVLAPGAFFEADASQRLLHRRGLEEALRRYGHQSIFNTDARPPIHQRGVFSMSSAPHHTPRSAWTQGLLCVTMLFVERLLAAR